MGFIQAVAQQLVITGLLLGVAKRSGVISVHPRSISHETGRRAFMLWVGCSDSIVGQVDSLWHGFKNSLK